MDFPLFNKESILCVSLYLLYNLPQKYTCYPETTFFWNTPLLWACSRERTSLFEIFDSLKSSIEGLSDATSVLQSLQWPCKHYKQQHTEVKSNGEALTASGELRLFRKPLLEWSIGALHIYQLTKIAMLKAHSLTLHVIRFSYFPLKIFSIKIGWVTKTIWSMSHSTVVLLCFFFFKVFIFIALLVLFANA